MMLTRLCFTGTCANSKCDASRGANDARCTSVQRCVCGGADIIQPTPAPGKGVSVSTHGCCSPSGYWDAVSSACACHQRDWHYIIREPGVPGDPGCCPDSVHYIFQLGNHTLHPNGTCLCKPPFELLSDGKVRASSKIGQSTASWWLDTLDWKPGAW